MTTTPQLAVQFSRNEAGSLLVLAGEIDVANVTDVRGCVDHAIASTTGTVSIDMFDVSYLDSVGLNMLLTARDQLRFAHRRLLITRASDQILRLFEICGVTAHLTSEELDS